MLHSRQLHLRGAKCYYFATAHLREYNTLSNSTMISCMKPYIIRWIWYIPILDCTCARWMRTFSMPRIRLMRIVLDVKIVVLGKWKLTQCSVEFIFGPIKWTKRVQEMLHWHFDSAIWRITKVVLHSHYVSNIRAESVAVFSRESSFATVVLKYDLKFLNMIDLYI